MKECKKWECVLCGSEWDKKEEADDCCVENKKVKSVYECPICGEIWDTKKEADVCCPKSDEFWTCGECGKVIYGEEGEELARICCTEEAEREEDDLCDDGNWFTRLWERIRSWFDDITT